MLTAELPTGEPAIAQQQPEARLGVGLVCAQASGEAQDVLGQL